MYLFQYRLPAQIALFITAVVSFGGSCNKSTAFENKIYFAQSVASQIVPLSIEEGQGTANLSLVSAKEAQDELGARVDVLDSTYLGTFNEQHQTNYKMAPASAIRLSASSLSISKGKAAADNALTVGITEWPGYIDGVQYAIPVKLTATGSAPVLSGSDVVILAVNKVINTTAAQNAGYQLDGTILGAGTEGAPLDNVTIEGKFMLTKSLIVPGNWRTDIFVGYGFQLCVFTAGGIDIRFPNSAFMFNENPPTSTILNAWNHFAITYKGGIVTLYINGQQSGSPYTYPGLTIDKPGIASYITNTGCTVSEFRIWNYVRSKKDLQTFACAVDPATPGLMAYWRFNEGAGNTIRDVTGKGHDLTATSAITWVSGVKCP